MVNHLMMCDVTRSEEITVRFDSSVSAEVYWHYRDGQHSEFVSGNLCVSDSSGIGAGGWCSSDA